MELFGDLIGLMRTIIDNDRRLQRHLSGEQKRMQTRRNLFESSETVPRRYRRLASISSTTTGVGSAQIRNDDSSECTATTPASGAYATSEVVTLASLSAQNLALQEQMEADRRRSSASHARLFANCSRRLSLDKGRIAAATATSATATNPPDAQRTAKLSRRWSFAVDRPLARSQSSSLRSSMRPNPGCWETRQDCATRLTLSSSIALARRHAEWIEGEKEFAANSHRQSHYSLSHRQALNSRRLLQQKTSQSLLRFNGRSRRPSRESYASTSPHSRRPSRESHASHCSWAETLTSESGARRPSETSCSSVLRASRILASAEQECKNNRNTVYSLKKARNTVDGFQNDRNTRSTAATRGSLFPDLFFEPLVRFTRRLSCKAAETATDTGTSSQGSMAIQGGRGQAARAQNPAGASASVPRPRQTMWARTWRTQAPPPERKPSGNDKKDHEEWLNVV